MTRYGNIILAGVSLMCLILAVSLTSAGRAVADVATVLIGNDANHPVLVSSANVPGQHVSDFKLAGQSATCDDGWTVPTGKRLVIQSVSLTAQVPGGTLLKQAFVRVTATDLAQPTKHSPAQLPISLHSQGTVSGTTTYTGNETLDAYADSGSDVNACVFADRNVSSGSMQVVYSGYLTPGK